ncbi:MAG: hypothetical protein AAGA54_20195 [Myxococcota bacterium]
MNGLISNALHTKEPAPVCLPSCREGVAPLPGSLAKSITRFGVAQFRVERSGPNQREDLFIADRALRSSEEPFRPTNPLGLTVLEAPATNATPVLGQLDQPRFDDVAQRVQALGLDRVSIHQRDGVIRAGRKKRLPPSKARVDSSSDELIELSEELGPVAVNVGQDHVVVIAQYLKLMDLDPCETCGSGEAEQKELVRQRRRSKEESLLTTPPCTHHDIAGLNEPRPAHDANPLSLGGLQAGAARQLASGVRWFDDVITGSEEQELVQFLRSENDLISVAPRSLVSAWPACGPSSWPSWPDLRGVDSKQQPSVGLWGWLWGWLWKQQPSVGLWG